MSRVNEEGSLRKCIVASSYSLHREQQIDSKWLYQVQICETPELKTKSLRKKKEKRRKEDSKEHTEHELALNERSTHRTLRRSSTAIRAVPRYVSIT